MAHLQVGFAVEYVAQMAPRGGGCAQKAKNLKE